VPHAPSIFIIILRINSSFSAPFFLLVVAIRRKTNRSQGKNITVKSKNISLKFCYFSEIC
jgi:hypothetical protein